MKSFKDISLPRPLAPAPREAKEQEARAVSRGNAPLARPASAPAAVLEGGVALPKAGLSGDFSRVRVHADPPAAEAADNLGARAFTMGSDIVFGSGQYKPASAAGQALIAHELVHTVQQAQSGEAALQMEPQKKQGGIGSHPPKDDFVTLTDASPEDDFILFGFDSADLTGRAEKKLTGMVSTLKAPVTVRIHGYASSEGDAEYNINLAAQRAAAIKHFLDSKIPKGSRVLLFSHGETTAFGKLEENRRGGVQITPGVSDKATEAKKPAGWTFDISMRKPGLDLGLGKPLYLTPPYLPPQAPFSPLSPIPTLPPLPKFSDMDWESIRSKYTAHGLIPDDRDYAAIERQWNYSYNFFLHLTTPDNAKSLTNLAVPFVVENYLERENPNALDRANQEFKTAYPNEIHTPIVPIISSDSLDWIYSKLKHSDKKEYPFRF